MPIRDPIAAQRLAAVRLALRLIAGGLASTAFTTEHQPLGDPFEVMDWLRTQLAPLARHDHTIRELLRVLDPVNTQRPPWTSPRGTKRELLRLAARVRARAPRLTPRRRPSQIR